MDKNQAVERIKESICPQLHVLNYLCNWSVAHKYVFMENPKVACTTVKKVLQTSEARVTGASVPDNVHDRVASPIAQVMDAPETFLSLMLAPDTFIFCFVRNPFSRALSCYLDKIFTNDWERNRLAPKLGLDPVTPASFREFLEAVRDAKMPEQIDIHWATQCSLLRPDLIDYDYIGRFENFGPSFSDICKQLGLDTPPTKGLRPHATGASDRILSHFGPEERDLVLDIYAEDFKAFGYGSGVRFM